MIRPFAAVDGDGDLVAALRTDEGLGPWDWATAGIVFIAAIVLGQVVRRILDRTLSSRIDPALATLISRLTGYVVVVFGLLYSLDSLGVAIVPVLGALGIAGIALAFALQDILENFVAGVLLQLQRPFTYGDQVSVNDCEGTVRAIDSRLVTIETPDGETVKIPSATVIKSELVNLTHLGRRRTTLEVGVAYGTDLAHARAVLDDAVRSVDQVREWPGPEVLLVGFGESSIDFVVRFWHAPSIADFWATRSEVAFAVERALAAAGITIPFPQRTLWNAGETDG